MAHTKALGSTKLGRDSIAKRLGVKINNGEAAMVGQIIVRQRGTKYLPGTNVRRAEDDTLYALKNGTVKFAAKTKKKFDGSPRRATMVSVVAA
jgi:large subunit ribosomal protein L27